MLGGHHEFYLLGYGAVFVPINALSSLGLGCSCTVLTVLFWVFVRLGEGRVKKGSVLAEHVGGP